MFYANKIGKHRISELNETFEFVYNDCGKPTALSNIHRQFAPHLFPFVIEYSILIVAIWCKMYENTGRCPRKSKENSISCEDNETNTPNEDSSEGNELFLLNSKCHWQLNVLFSKIVMALPEHSDRFGGHKAIQSSFYIYADCKSSLNGIFLGLLLVIMTIVFVILMFACFQNR